MQRREFLRTVEVSTVATAAGVLAGQSAEAGTRVAAEKPYAFRLGIYLPELGLPLDESLEVARQVGSKHVWFSRITGEPDVASWSDARAAKVAAQVKAHDLDIFLLNAGNPFKKIHLADLDYKTLARREGALAHGPRLHLQPTIAFTRQGSVQLGLAGGF